MTFKNDTKYPILIRTYARPGIVRFTIYSVPTGRQGHLQPADREELQAGLHGPSTPSRCSQGVREQVEYQADGQDVWVTRFVKDKTGKVIHKETFYSHYAQMIGVVLIGRKS